VDGHMTDCRAVSSLPENRKQPQDATDRRKTPSEATDPMKNVTGMRHNDSEMR